MVTVNGSWSDSENAWVSEVMEPTGDIWVEVELPSKGYVVIRQIDRETKKAPKCYQSQFGEEFRLRVFYCDANNIQIFTSLTPKRIEYANV